MKRFFIIALLLGSFESYSKTLGDFTPTTNPSFALGKAKGEKDIYIASFTVNYQVYNEKEDFKQGGRAFGGGAFKGDALAALSVGLTGISEQDVQSTTDKLYQDFLATIKAKGLNVITADQAGKADTYSDYTRLEGGRVSKSQYDGLLSVTPTGYSYYVKSIKKDGKEKKGGFLGQPHFVYGKLSKDLDDAIIANVELFVTFVKDKNAWGGAGANVKVETQLRVAAVEGIVSKSDAKIKLKGQNSVEMVTSTVGFYRGKAGAGPETMHVGILKKPLLINGVVESKKLQSFAANRTDFTGTSAGLYTFYNPENVKSTNSNVIQVDGAQYAKGTYEACKKLIDHHTNEFFSKL
jgi:hypothetical protein